jgi:hypothetical protein
MMAGFLGKMFRLSNPPVLTCGDDGFSIAVGVSSFFFFFFLAWPARNDIAMQLERAMISYPTLQNTTSLCM